MLPLLQAVAVRKKGSCFFREELSGYGFWWAIGTGDENVKTVRDIITIEWSTLEFWNWRRWKEEEEFRLYLSWAGESDEKWKPWRILGQGVVGVAVLARNGVVVNGLEVVFEFIGSRELSSTHQTRKHLTLIALMIKIRVPLEAVLILECPRHVFLLAGYAAVHALFRDGCVAEEIQSANGHFLQLLRVVRVAVGAAQQRSVGCTRPIPLRRAGQIV